MATTESSQPVCQESVHPHSTVSIPQPYKRPPIPSAPSASCNPQLPAAPWHRAALKRCWPLHSPSLSPMLQSSSTSLEPEGASHRGCSAVFLCSTPHCAPRAGVRASANLLGPPAIQCMHDMDEGRHQVAWPSSTLAPVNASAREGTPYSVVVVSPRVHHLIDLVVVWQMRVLAVPPEGCHGTGSGPEEHLRHTTAGQAKPGPAPGHFSPRRCVQAGRGRVNQALPPLAREGWTRLFHLWQGKGGPGSSASGRGTVNQSLQPLALGRLSRKSLTKLQHCHPWRIDLAAQLHHVHCDHTLAHQQEHMPGAPAPDTSRTRSASPGRPWASRREVLR